MLDRSSVTSPSPSWPPQVTPFHEQKEVMRRSNGMSFFQLVDRSSALAASHCTGSSSVHMGVTPEEARAEAVRMETVRVRTSVAAAVAFCCAATFESVSDRLAKRAASSGWPQVRSAPSSSRRREEEMTLPGRQC